MHGDLKDPRAQEQEQCKNIVYSTKILDKVEESSQSCSWFNKIQKRKTTCIECAQKYNETKGLIYNCI